MLPPEVISTLIYSGPGPGSLLAAAGAWDATGDQLAAAAAAVDGAVAGLPWSGPAATAARTWSVGYSAWLGVAAGMAHESAVAASAAAAAFEVVYAAVIPPAVVFANRAELLALAATNVLGQNAVAIAACEAAYAVMGATNEAAMAAYTATAGAAAAGLVPFVAPPPAPAGAAGDPGGGVDPVVDGFDTAAAVAMVSLLGGQAKYVTDYVDLAALTPAFAAGAAGTPAVVAQQPAAAGAAVPPVGGAGAGRVPVAATLGAARPVGGLSAPAGTVVTAPPTGGGAGPAVPPGGGRMLPLGMPLPMGGGRAGAAEAAVVKYGTVVGQVMVGHPSGG